MLLAAINKSVKTLQRNICNAATACLDSTVQYLCTPASYMTDTCSATIGSACNCLDDVNEAPDLCV